MFILHKSKAEMSAHNLRTTVVPPAGVQHLPPCGLKREKLSTEKSHKYKFGKKRLFFIKSYGLKVVILQAGKHSLWQRPETSRRQAGGASC